MKHNLLLPFVIFYMSCTDDTPECISNHVETFKINQLDCEGATIAKYQFQGQEVYAFSDGQCISDGGTQIWDSECNSVCFLGGIAAFELCMNRDFYEEAIFLESIYSQ